MAITVTPIREIFSADMPVRTTARSPKRRFRPLTGLSLFGSSSIALPANCTPIWAYPTSPETATTGSRTTASAAPIFEITSSIIVAATGTVSSVRAFGPIEPMTDTARVPTVSIR